jgi:hypothetical protein
MNLTETQETSNLNTQSMDTPMIVGRTKVRVMRNEINEQTKREAIREIHRGVVVGFTTSFARVYNPLPRDKGGDVSPQTSEAFPLHGKRCWCEIIGELEENRAIDVPAEMRN